LPRHPSCSSKHHNNAILTTVEMLYNLIRDVFYCSRDGTISAAKFHVHNCIYSRELSITSRTTLNAGMNQAYSEYKHVLANILRSLFVARTLPLEARSPDCRSNVENAPVGGRSPAGRPRPLPVCGVRFWGRPPVARRSPAGGARRPRPAGRSHYVVISQDGRKLVTRVRVMLP